MESGQNTPPERRWARVVYRGGIREDLQLLAVPQGWRISSIPLGSDVLAFGDWVTLREDRTRGELPMIVGIRAGGYRTLCSRTPIPPDEAVLTEITQRHWRAAWNADGHLSVAVPVADLDAARRALRRWERSGKLIARNGTVGTALTA